MNGSTGKRGRTRTAGPPPHEHLGRNRVGLVGTSTPGLATGMTQNPKKDVGLCNSFRLSRTVQATVCEKTTMSVQRCHEIVQVTYSGFCT